MSGKEMEKRNSHIVLKLMTGRCSRLQECGIDGRIETETRSGPARFLPDANAVTGAVHDRMPVILDAHDFDLWLDPGMINVTEVFDLLKPYDACLMRCYPVSSRVNSVINDGEECSQQVKPASVQHHLFS
jgi:SOS response associated peptidase (SRAP)